MISRIRSTTASPTTSTTSIPQPEPITKSLSMDRISSMLHMNKFSSVEEWLDAELKNHRFCVLIFYRADWDHELWSYFSVFMDAVPALRKQGGELFAVIPKSKSERKKMEKHLGLNFKIISDPDDLLANKYKINTCQADKKGSLLKTLLEKVRRSPPITRHRSSSFPPTTPDETVYKASHPGVLILSSKKKAETGQWVTSRTIKNHYENRECFTPTSLNELLDLHFDRRRSVPNNLRAS